MKEHTDRYKSAAERVSRFANQVFKVSCFNCNLAPNWKTLSEKEQKEYSDKICEISGNNYLPPNPYALLQCNSWEKINNKGDG